MIDMAALITRERIVLGLPGGSKEHVLEVLAGLAGDALGRDRAMLRDALAQREKLGTTGLGDGIAIPHARIAGLDRQIGFFARLDRPVDFDALDGEPVDLVFMLVAPEGSGSEALKALARIARILRDADLCRGLREARDVAAAESILTGRPDPALAGGARPAA